MFGHRECRLRAQRARSQHLSGAMCINGPCPAAVATGQIRGAATAEPAMQPGYVWGTPYSSSFLWCGIPANKARTSDSRYRRCPPSVRIDESLPALAHRVTVFGSTRNKAATSAGVKSGSASGERVVMSSSSNGADAPTLDIVPCQFTRGEHFHPRFTPWEQYLPVLLYCPQGLMCPLGEGGSPRAEHSPDTSMCPSSGFIVTSLDIRRDMEGPDSYKHLFWTARRNPE